MRRVARASRVLIALAVSAGCARRVPLVAYAPLASGLEAYLAAHPLAPEQEVRADEIGRTAGASYHLVQVRGAERPHRHASHDLAVFVLIGGGTLTRGQVRLQLRAGDAAIVPRGDPHWFANAGQERTVTLAVFTPPLDSPDVVPDDGR